MQRFSFFLIYVPFLRFSLVHGFYAHFTVFLMNATQIRLFRPVTFRRSAAGFLLQFSFQFSFEKRRFRSISRTTDFGRLVPLPFGAVEGPRKGLFSDAPFGQFCLAAYLSGVLPSCLCGVRSFRRLGMHLSGPSEFAFCIDKALVHAPFKS